jgi:oligogalacturonide lyase
MTRRSTLLAIVLAVMPGAALAADDGVSHNEWIDAKTGHRIVRLSTEAGSNSFYFHQNAFSADGTKLVINTPHGLSSVDLATHEIAEVVAGRVQPLVTGRKTGDIYFLRDGAVWAANLNSHDIRQVAQLPPRLNTANVTVNADETMLVAVAVDPDGAAEPRELDADQKNESLAARWAAGLPMVMYTIDVATGDTKIILHSHDWLNHLQCSPTDPQQILFCHEGPWHLVDRSWLIRADGRGFTQVHHRLIPMEIAGHEFFSSDGNTVWYDLQTPRSEQFWLAGYNMQSGTRTWFQLARDQWSVHYNVSPDGTMFAGDGGGPNSVANQTADHHRLDPSGNGQWIYLFRPEVLPKDAGPKAIDANVTTGVMHAERLVDLSQHDYSLEPNVMFTPDGKWIVFRSNMQGNRHVYAVEIARTEQ